MNPATPEYKILKDSNGNRAVKYGSTIVPADIAGLCTGRDRWLAEIECKCRDCGQLFPLRKLQGGGQWCEDCQAKSFDSEEYEA